VNKRAVLASKTNLRELVERVSFCYIYSSRCHLQIWLYANLASSNLSVSPLDGCIWLVSRAALNHWLSVCQAMKLPRCQWDVFACSYFA